LKKFRENRKAVSPVISTIIIVAVAIAISIAVAFWLGGITSIFTRFEKLEITSAYAKAENQIGGKNTWLITMEIKNTGTSDTTIVDIFINNVPIFDYGTQIYNKAGTASGKVTFDSTDVGTNVISWRLPAGGVVTLTFQIVDGAFSFTAGQSITITLHTAGGQDYPKTVVLP